jgi:hypothetical protein
MMNREIKFRAWDSHTEQMIIDVLAWTRKDGHTSVILPHGLKSEKAYAVVGDHWKKDDFGNQYSDLNVVIPMQYTGLHDKNGVEIYEGDIVRDIRDGDVDQIIWNNDYPSFQIEHPEQPWYSPLVKGFMAARCEVIGNIYENPELLTKA